MPPQISSRKIIQTFCHQRICIKLYFGKGFRSILWFVRNCDFLKALEGWFEVDLVVWWLGWLVEGGFGGIGGIVGAFVGWNSPPSPSLL